MSLYEWICSSVYKCLLVLNEVQEFVQTCLTNHIQMWESCLTLSDVFEIILKTNNSMLDEVKFNQDPPPHVRVSGALQKGVYDGKKKEHDVMFLHCQKMRFLDSVTGSDVAFLQGVCVGAATSPSHHCGTLTILKWDSAAFQNDQSQTSEQAWRQQPGWHSGVASGLPEARQLRAACLATASLPCWLRGSRQC